MRDMASENNGSSARRTREAWAKFLLTRVAGAVLDAGMMGLAYLGAFALRMDFHEPACGWRAVAVSFATVWAVQMTALLATGCYAVPWRRIRTLDLPRYLGAVLASCAVLTLLRVALPDGTMGHVRPPYSVTLFDAVLWGVLLIGSRGLWRLYMQARQDEKKLLRRAEASLVGADVLEMLRGQTVLVTGAGGTIGGEIVRQVARGGAARVVMAERSENALYEIDREMRGAGVNAACVPEMADIADEARMRGVLAKWRPSIVLHAAAYKHVPMVEANPLDGLRNNALATRRLGELCREAGVARFVMISTDKAVNPISVMGMTKRLAEVLLLGLNAASPDASSRTTGQSEQSGSPTRFSCVRFGNVLGSSGSVVPLFREQIAKKGPVTVTHPEMKRYFMSVEEAVGLVLEAAAQGGDCIYTLDMGEPVKIVDLAEDMIRQAGYRPYVDVPIVFTGIRPGEKLFEELDVSERSAYRTGHARVFVCKNPGRGAGVTAEEVRAFADGRPSDEAVRAFLREKTGG